MKKILSILCVALAFIAVPAASAAKIRVITTIPDLADITREIGGDLVEVESLATGVEDPHGVPMSPRFATKLNRADLVVVMGMELEHAFMPGLIDASKNPRIQPGKPGYIDTSRDISPLEVPKTLSRSEGEIHPSGNPHYNLDPVLGRSIAQTIQDGLAANFPQHAPAFKAGLDAYLAKLDRKITAWEEMAKTLKGLKFVSYHNEWPYFSKRYGLEYLDTIELKHGIEPTARHLTELISRMKNEGCRLVAREPQFSERVPNEIAAQTGGKVVKLAIMVGGVPEAKTYIDLIDYNIRTLVEAAKAAAGSAK